MTKPLPRGVRGLTRQRHLHISPELFNMLSQRAKQWHWPSTSLYVEHELRRILDMPTDGFERKPMPAQFSLAQNQGHHIILCAHKGIMYVFRYAQKTEELAREVMQRLQANFGKPKDIATDLACNYWVWPAGVKLKFMQRTTQKDSWYIDEPGAVTP